MGALAAAVLLVAAACSPSGDPAAGNAEIAALRTSISGGGASFPDSFYQAVTSDFNELAGTERVAYAKSGSSDGRAQLIAGTLDYAGSDALPEQGERYPGELLLFPTVAAPITVSYHLDGVDGLRLSAPVIAGIFQAQITSWDDESIAADNPGVELPARRILVVHRSDGSGTTNNFTRYLVSAAPEVWTLGSGDEVNWPSTTQGAEKNSGVAEVIKQTDGAIGYVDISDAGKAHLSLATIRNARGEYVEPSYAATQAALDGAEVAADLSYDPLDSDGEGAYPITAPTWLLVLAEQPDAGTAETLRTYLRYVLTTGQDEAATTGYAGLPDAMLAAAIEQIDRIGST